ncbi:MAG: hypothetical protein M1379_15625, partial [Firmicutes bacterium]|nr:hypothetical protein [Bacillota bacterium]
VANALSPAKVVSVYPEETTKAARVVVPDHQLSLAIGKEGQNARLAARLTGWKIDIKSETQMAEILEKEAELRQAEAALATPEEAPEAIGEPVAQPGEVPVPEVLEPIAVGARSVEETEAIESEGIDADLLDSLVAELIGGTEKGKKSVAPASEPAKPKKAKKSAAPKKEKPVILKDLKELELLKVAGEESDKQAVEEGVSGDQPVADAVTDQPEPARSKKKTTRSRKNPS